jgi:PAS domain S-box-containing protein
MSGSLFARPDAAGRRGSPGVSAERHPAGGSRPADWSSGKIEQLRRRESELWRISLLIIVFLAAALAFNSIETLKSLSERALRDLAALPAGVLVLMVLFAAYVWNKKREVDELRVVVQGLEAGAQAPATAEQVERLLEVISHSQEGFRDLVDGMEHLALNLTLDGRIRAANRAVTELLDAPFPDVVGHRVAEFVDDLPEAQIEKQRALFFERRHWTGALRVRIRKTRSVRYLDCVLRAIVRNGEVVGLSCIARDITQQREAEVRFTELFETLQEGVYFTTPDGRLIDANPALVRMLGYDSKEELLEINVLDLYWQPEDRQELMAELDRKYAVREREIILRRKDGTPLYCLDTSTACRDPYGHVVRYQGTLVDITHRREMEQRLHAEKEFARRLVDSLPDLVVVLDPHGRYTYVSPRIKEVLGFSPEEILRQQLGERTHPEDQRLLVGLHKELLEGKRTYATVEYRTQHKDGSWRTMRATACALRDAAGNITGVIASARDMTEVKRLERQVGQSEKLAALGQMIAGIAHELNNPLTAILGINELLRERVADESARRQMELVQRQARRAAEIVQNLLTFARPPAPSRAPLNLAELVLHTLQLHEYSLHVNHVAIDVQIPGECKPEQMWVLGDSNQLMQVFLNLIINAEQAIHEIRDSGKLTVRFGNSIESGRSAVWVSFHNDGPPIPAEILPKIFDPFFTTKRPGRGTGLGLSICMAIVREHNGTIEACTPAEGGAEFRVLFPLHSVAAADLGVASRQMVASSPLPVPSGNFARPPAIGFGAPIAPAETGEPAPIHASKK